MAGDEAWDAAPPPSLVPVAFATPRDTSEAKAPEVVHEPPPRRVKSSSDMEAIEVLLTSLKQLSRSKELTVAAMPPSVLQRAQAGEQARPPALCSYEAFMWVTSLTVAVVSAADRFIWNVWPRQMFQIGAGNAGSDILVGYLPGPWSVVTYDVLARISGRFSIVTFNLMLVVRLRCLAHLLTTSRLAPYIHRVLDCSNLVQVRATVSIFTLWSDHRS